MQKPSSHQKPPNSPLPKNPVDFSLFSPMQSSKNEHSFLADYVDVESYVDLKSDLNLEPYKWFSGGGGGGGFERREEARMAMKREKQREREYPPSIPWLAHTENLPTSQMPWVMKRYYTPDGRLIIKEEKVKRFEYFEAHRNNGRLMLNLVPLNDDVSCSDDDDDVDVDVDECVKEEDNCDDSAVMGGCDQAKVDRTDGNESALVNGGGAPVIGGGGSGGGSKCSSLFTFGVAVPAIRPVHT